MVQDTGNKQRDVEKTIAEEVIYKGPCFGVRHIQILLLFLLMTIAYCLRINLSVGIVAMTDPKANPDFPTYDWDDQETILSSFFWGYVLPQVGAGQIAKNWGPRWVLIGCMTICGIFTVLVPVMADFGSYGVMICRIIQGFSQGFVFPCTHNLLSKWIPLEERTRLGTFVYAGGPFGTVLAMPITGWICASSIGWPGAFYVFGGIGFAWVLLYLLLGANSPLEHRTISEEERSYLKKALGQEVGHSNVATPWLDIFKSLPMWAILIAHCGQNWGFWTLLTQIPKYMNKILEYDISSNGLLSALPYFVLWIASFFFGGVSNMLTNKNIISIEASRKINTAIGMFVPAIALLTLGILQTRDSGTTIALLVVAVGMNAGTYSGYQVNHIDLSPKHAGTLMGITNGTANIFSIISTYVVQYIVTGDKTDISQWGTLFYIASGAYVGCALCYMYLGSGERQYWDDGPNTKSEPKYEQD